uniref:Short cationic peptide-4f n=1 Tax=Cupiennius salei TaxID=6928 RepID=TXS4F_CUPSA|nr:RecName: Full=Short cationic peptide-4f; Short=SCP-4f; AltName: Full=Short cationic peptide-4g; Short=SCP-4g; AltName: Full=Truncated variant of Cupiennin 4 family [Cupiennius salei]
VYGMLFKFL